MHQDGSTAMVAGYRRGSDVSVRESNLPGAAAKLIAGQSEPGDIMSVMDPRFIFVAVSSSVNDDLRHQDFAFGPVPVRNRIGQPDPAAPGERGTAK